MVEMTETVSFGGLYDDGVTVVSISDSFVGGNKGTTSADLSTPYICTSSSILIWDLSLNCKYPSRPITGKTFSFFFLKFPSKSDSPSVSYSTQSSPLVVEESEIEGSEAESSNTLINAFVDDVSDFVFDPPISVSFYIKIMWY